MPQQMGWREASIEILKDHPEGLLYTEIANKIIERKLRSSFGATPSGSVNVAISNAIQLSEHSPFERIAPGLYRLRTLSLNISSSLTALPDGATQGDAPEATQKKQTTGLINALGMLWSRDRVQWNPVTPKLLGRQALGTESVDFSDQRGVYLLYDRNEVVYVGRAIDQGIGTRLRQHIADRLGSRWDRFSWFGVYGVSESGSLISEEQIYDRSILIATMEALLIESVEPTQNRRRGDDFQAIEFLQVEDPEIEKSRKKLMMLQLAAQFGS